MSIGGPVQVLHLARHALSQHHLRDKVTMSTRRPGTGPAIGGHKAQCRVLLPGYERGEYLRGARPGWEARPAAVGEQGWCVRDRWTRSPVRHTFTWI
jgi:hypothetical protein